MNGYELIARAAALIGMEKADDTLKIIGLPLVNAVLEELGFTVLSSLSEGVGIISQKQTSALLFGLAALIASAVGDDAASSTMSAAYKKRLSALKSSTARVKDRLPRGDWL